MVHVMTLLRHFGTKDLHVEGINFIRIVFFVCVDKTIITFIFIRFSIESSIRISFTFAKISTYNLPKNMYVFKTIDDYV